MRKWQKKRILTYLKKKNEFEQIEGKKKENSYFTGSGIILVLNVRKIGKKLKEPNRLKELKDERATDGQRTVRHLISSGDYVSSEAKKLGLL